MAAYPASAKVPDAMLNIATNQIALDNLAGARKTLEELVAKYPGTNGRHAGEPPAGRTQVSVVAEAARSTRKGRPWSRR